jgi:hypothetical protein
MERKPRRLKERPAVRSAATADQGPVSLDKAGETADSAEHKVVFLGWFGLSRRLDSDFEPYRKRSRRKTR